MQSRAFLGAPSSLNKAERTCEFVASTTAIDSHGSIIQQNWRLDRYRANPVILWAHDDDDMPIGTGDVRLEDNQLIVKVKFAEGTKCADEAWTLVQQGVLRAVSVSFRPGKIEFQEVEDRTVVVYDSPELCEISLVSVPSNPESLARSHKPTRSMSAPLEKTMQEETVVERAEPVTTAPVASEPAADPTHRALLETIREREDVIDILKANVDAKDRKIAELERKLESTKASEAEAYVRTFVGKKILSRQVDAWVPVAAANRAQFDKIMASMSDLRLAERIVESKPVRTAKDPAKEMESLTRRYMDQGMPRYEAIRKAAIDLAGTGEDQ